ncbi:Transposable element Tcb2 transposase, partial [Stegodyphus mimosarum]
MLENFVFPQLEELQPHVFLQQYDAPPHWGTIVGSSLNDHFTGRWTGEGGPIPWPPRSPDITPLDFFLWGFVKNNVYRRRVSNMDDLKPGMTTAIASVGADMLAARLQWCRVHSHWNVTDWSRIAFSDESRFELSPDDQRRRVWRHPGQLCDANLTVFRQTGRGVMVWGAISFHSRTPLVVFRRNLTAQRYVDEVIRPVVLPFMSRHPGLTFKQDNACPHTAHVSSTCLSACRTLPWPTRSPDLSLIEHVWGIMDKALQPARDVDDLTHQLDRIWHNIPQVDIRNLY